MVRLKSYAQPHEFGKRRLGSLSVQSPTENVVGRVHLYDCARVTGKPEAEYRHSNRFRIADHPPRTNFQKSWRDRTLIQNATAIRLQQVERENVPR